MAPLALGTAPGGVGGLAGLAGGQPDRRDHDQDGEGQRPGEGDHQRERGHGDQEVGDQAEDGVGDHVLDAVDVGVDPREQVAGLVAGEEPDRLIKQRLEQLAAQGGHDPLADQRGQVRFGHPDQTRE